MSNEDDFDVNDFSMADIGELNQEGYVDLDLVADDPRVFHDQFENRSRELQRTPPSTSAVTVIPSRSGPWSGNPQLGIEQPFAPASNNRQTILKLSEWGFPAVWTVQLGLSFDPDFLLVGTDGFSINARIEAGSGGAIQLIDVDWLQGAALSIPMNALNVIAEYDEISDIPPDLRLIVTISPGKMTNARPTKTFYLSIPPTDERVIEIPKFAKRVFIGDTASAGASVYSVSNQTSLLPTQAGGAGLRVLGTTLLSLGGWLPIPNGARFLRIQNVAAGPAPNMVATAIFELCL